EPLQLRRHVARVIDRIVESADGLVSGIADDEGDAALALGTSAAHHEQRQEQRRQEKSPHVSPLSQSSANQAPYVIARSEATNQSIIGAHGEMDCFATLAMTSIRRTEVLPTRHILALFVRQRDLCCRERSSADLPMMDLGYVRLRRGGNRMRRQ